MEHQETSLNSIISAADKVHSQVGDGSSVHFVQQIMNFAMTDPTAKSFFLVANFYTLIRLIYTVINKLVGEDLRNNIRDMKWEPKRLWKYFKKEEPQEVKREINEFERLNELCEVNVV